jgi:Zn-finger nucleic acid-binding protein
MKCPTCESADLTMTERQGIEIDYCPKCRGVWLDRGELDKLIERATQFGATPAPYQAADSSGPPPLGQTRRRDDDDDDDDDDDRRRQRGYGDPQYGAPQRRRRGGFLGELFDWD